MSNNARKINGDIGSNERAGIYSLTAAGRQVARVVQTGARERDQISPPLEGKNQ